MNKADKVHEIVKNCLFKEEEIIEDPILVEGILNKFIFHPERVKSHKEEIRALLNEMPDDFHRHTGGGMSFLNLCMDKHGAHWAEHPTMGELVCLGIAAGMASYCVSRDMWHIFPGGMPYVVFDTIEDFEGK